MTLFQNWGQKLISGAGVAVLILGVGCSTTQSKNARVLSSRASVAGAYVGERSIFAIEKKWQKKERMKQMENLGNLQPIAPLDLTPLKPLDLEPTKALPTYENRKLMTYKVKKGDTLGHIALAYKVGVNELAVLNGMDKNDVLYIGKKLKIPAGGIRPRTAPHRLSKRNVKYYTVQKGDILGRIAKKTGTSVKDLKNWNKLSGDKIFIGQKLALESGGKVQKHKSVSIKRASSKSGVHTVKSGESLSTIAHRYGMSVSALKGFNGLTTNHIVPGQKLFLRDGVDSVAVAKNKISPAPKAKEALPADGKYTVKSGDSLWKIARRFGIPQKHIKKLNNLTSDVVFPGTTLIIAKDTSKSNGYDGHEGVATQSRPAPITSTVVKSALKEAAPMPVAKQVTKNMTKLPHFVDQANDTLDEIADMYGSKKAWILEANPNVKSNSDLRLVKEIQVPVEELQLKQ